MTASLLISVAVVDPLRIVRESLEVAFVRHSFSVFTYESAMEFKASCVNGRVHDVVVADVADSPTVAALVGLLDSLVPGRVLALFGEVKPQILRLVVAAGAAAVVSKNCSSDLLSSIVVDLAAGNSVPYEGRFITDDGPVTKSANPPSLSDNEVALLGEIVAGRNPGEIARTRNLAAKTINNQLALIARKLGAASATQAVIAAIRHGLLTTDSEIHRSAS